MKKIILNTILLFVATFIWNQSFSQVTFTKNGKEVSDLQEISREELVNLTIEFPKSELDGINKAELIIEFNTDEMKPIAKRLVSGSAYTKKISPTGENWSENDETIVVCLIKSEDCRAWYMTNSATNIGYHNAKIKVTVKGYVEDGEEKYWYNETLKTRKLYKFKKTIGETKTIKVINPKKK